MGEGERRRQLMGAFWGAVLLSVILALVPGGRYALYPFSLLATWAHELGHGFTALLVGGEFERLVLLPDLGGTAYYRHPGGFWRTPLVAAGGLLGPSIAGGVVIVLGARPRTAPKVVAALAGLLLLSLALWVRNPFGMLAVGLLGGAFCAVAAWAPESVRLVTAQLCGIQLALGSLGDFGYMFTKEFQRDGKVLASDTQQIAEHLWLPYWFWGALIAALTVAILVSAFRLAWMRERA